MLIRRLRSLVRVCKRLCHNSVLGPASIRRKVQKDALLIGAYPGSHDERLQFASRLVSSLSSSQCEMYNTTLRFVRKDAEQERAQITKSIIAPTLGVYVLISGALACVTYDYFWLFMLPPQAILVFYCAAVVRGAQFESTKPEASTIFNGVPTLQKALSRHALELKAEPYPFEH